MVTKVAVIGGGTMGNGIAQICAQNDLEVSVTDLSEEVLVSTVHRISESLDRMVLKNIIDNEIKISGNTNSKFSIIIYLLLSCYKFLLNH